VKETLKFDTDKLFEWNSMLRQEEL